MARSVVIAFEADRLGVVAANAIDPGRLPQAPQGMRQLPNFGVMRVATTRPASSKEFFESVDLSAAGISPAMRPGRWRPWEDARDAIAQRARPVAELLAARPRDAAVLQGAIRASGLPEAELRYLPLTSSRTKDWVALLDGGLNMVGWAPMDGF